MSADSPIQYIKGVGPRRAEAFASLGLHTVDDLLHHFPFRHETQQGELEIADLVPGITATIQGEVVHLHRRHPHLRAEIDDGTERCELRWFNASHLGQGMRIGATVIATGKVQEFNGVINLVQPNLRVFEPDTMLPARRNDGAQRVGVYRGNAQIKSPTIRRAVDVVLDQSRLPIDELLPPALLRKHGLPGREAAIRAMHRPKDDAELSAARSRLAYEEFLLMELALAIRRYRLLSLQTGRKLSVTPEIDARIRARFPFKLTGSQEKVVREINRDLASGHPMTRLLQGDVGSGKTVVALYAALVAIANRRQAAIMAPTEILAAQHFRKIEQYLDDSRVRRTLLRGKLPPKERTAALERIEAGAVDLIVGTQALLEQDVAFKDLALVVVDEQHKFGVLQRADFRTKGPMPHYLVMTATPIPRTLAMTVFGDLDVSIIDDCPPGRGKVVTKIVTPGKRDTVLKYVRRRLENGEQAYVVCPLIGESTNEERAGQAQDTRSAQADHAGRLSAVQVSKELSQGPWRGLRLGLLHGGLKSDEKQRLIGGFADGRLHALVSTTVVEVGIDVPNATIMIVENADRFGLSQLHQLRGRIGRGPKDSLCVLISRSRTKKARERLAVLAETTDGFKIAQADLRQRGPGELLGTRQSGLPELRVGDLIEDFELLERARRDAFEIIASDPRLERPQHRSLVPVLRKLFAGKLALIDAG